MVESSMTLNDILSKVEETDELIIGSGAVSECAGMLKKYWPGCIAFIIADSNTWDAAGKELFSILSDSGIEMAAPLIFPVPPMLHADYEYVETIRKKAEALGDSVLIAAGSGTINDLVKRSSSELEKPYLSFGTAASMDGYCSSGAALLKNGVKQTMECAAPKVIIADTDILESAPSEASAAGYGDLASKLTAGADWIIADITGDDPIVEDVWNIVQPRLSGWLENPGKLDAVFEGLNFSGLAMQVLGRSRAASGAEHLFSHIWEMSGHLGADGNPVSHGFQVSIGILCSCALVDEVLSIEAGEINIEEAVENYPDWKERSDEITALMSHLPSWEEYLDICRVKHLEKEQLKRKLAGIKERWPELKKRVRERLPEYRNVRRILEAANCPVKPEDINLDRKDAIAAYRTSQCMRNRYTILDLAYELGIFSQCINSIEESDEYLR